MADTTSKEDELRKIIIELQNIYVGEVPLKNVLKPQFITNIAYFIKQYGIQERIDELSNLRLMEFENGRDDFVYYDVDDASSKIKTLKALQGKEE